MRCTMHVAVILRRRSKAATSLICVSVAEDHGVEAAEKIASSTDKLRGAGFDGSQSSLCKLDLGREIDRIWDFRHACEKSVYCPTSKWLIRKEALTRTVHAARQ